MLEICNIRSHAIDLPLKDVFQTAQGRKTVAPSVIVDLELSNGIHGFGSATPAKYVTGEDAASVRSSIEMASLELIGVDAASYRGAWRRLAEILPKEASARAAIEIAVMDAFCRSRRLPMCQVFGGSLSVLETDITIPIVAPEAARALARESAAHGFKHLKIKVGQNPDEDMARVRAAAEGAPGCGIRIDANQGFTPAAAVKFISSLKSAGVKLDMVEQPVHRDDLDGLKHVTQQSAVPVFADESVITPLDALKLIRMDAVGGINVKLMKSGLAGALEIITLCGTAGIELMLGCMIETGIGMSAAVHMACGTGAFGRIDLDAHLLTRNPPLCKGGFAYSGSLLMVDDRAYGHGCAPTKRTATRQCR